MAHTKAGGSTKLGRDSKSKRLGVKRGQGQFVATGEILVRQRGTRYVAGQNVRRAGDDTLYSLENGIVKFRAKRKVNFDARRRRVTQVAVERQS
jgi:large subunit ribosomal protein L27